MKSTSFSLEESMKQLESIEEYFQKSDMNLDEAIVQHKKAHTLAKEITHYLATAESSISKITNEL
jgi:exodeoxyribonuclease VII small subunit